MSETNLYKQLKIFCITNKEIKDLEKFNFNLVGVGENFFPDNYINCKSGENIQSKEKYYSELTFHYWFWKNELSKYDENSWIGFCQKRRFWLKERKKEIKNLEELKNNLLIDIPHEWNNYNSVLCDPIDVSGAKKMKMIKRGFKNLIIDPTIFFKKNKQTIKLHFDMHHGFGLLDQAINLMNNEDREEFRIFVNTNSIFNPHIMFISKKKIINKWFEDLFKWLFDCEKKFGFKSLKGYDSQRLYAYLAERYLSFWFKKYSNWVEWPYIFVDTEKRSDF